jgi:hypothetical protein
MKMGRDAVILGVVLSAVSGAGDYQKGENEKLFYSGRYPLSATAGKASEAPSSLV